MTTSRAVEAPSQFAALLRRSKFASYDQRIGQVYTAYGGYAHRGDWGLKRPLPNRIRTKRPYISISAVDSLHEQTEWDRRGPAVRFLQGLNESGVNQLSLPLDMSRISPNSTMDSDFCKPPGSDPFKIQASGRAPSKHVAVQNTDSMRPQRFAKYLERIRASRPDFKQWVVQPDQDKDNSAEAYNIPPERMKRPEDVLPSIRSGPYSIPKEVSELKLDIASTNAEYAQLPDGFISQEVSLAAGAERSEWIEQRPHHLGALSYSQTSALQSHILFPPVKGRLVEVIDLRRSEPTTESFVAGTTGAQIFTAAIGGVLAKIEGPTVSAQKVMDFGPYSKPEAAPDKWIPRRPNFGVMHMRLISGMLTKMPRVVGPKPEDLKEGTSFANLRAEGFRGTDVTNPYIWGSREWVAMAAPQRQAAPSTVIIPRAAPPMRTAPKREQVTNVLNILASYMRKPEEEEPDE
ncbi:mitochondrial ribosomal protein subunit-domain-containing protein [Auriculariales sp. MPI-PUGE-AT-0066]|nr:mitochondrial ribosomal protein subunit-domain-containing protein [Auriculariales sp. MPI-PUGE-AT-0066]